MTDDPRLRRLRFRAWHRGTREADYVVGGYFDAHHRHWDEAALSWFEALIEEQDVDILAWAMGQADAPEHLSGPMMEALRKLDFVNIPR